MGPEAVTTLAVTGLIAVLGWLVAHYLSIRQAMLEKQREYRTTFLVQSYRDLVSFANDGLETGDDFRKIRNAINDIYLFGTYKQYKCLDNLKPGTTQTLELGPLIGALKDELRRDLGLPKLPVEGHYFAMNWTGIEYSQRDMESPRSNYLSKAYKVILSTLNNENPSQLSTDALYDALMDIWLYGTAEQAELASNVADQANDKNLQNLLIKLHSDLRSDWGLDPSTTVGSLLRRNSHILDNGSNDNVEKEATPSTDNHEV